MQLEIFKFRSDEEHDFSEVRTIEENGKILFCATDVARVLGYAKPQNAILNHCKGTLKRGVPTNSGFQTMNFIPEGDVYRLIVRSQLPSAERFEHWLFEEVVPSIRNKGYYGKIDRVQLPNFIERYKDNIHKIPGDYFSVISEMFVRMYAELEKVGYSIPNKGEDGKQMMPDISVGRGFAKFLKDNNSEFWGTHKKYNHTFPDGRVVEANMYKIDALPMFIRYINECWLFENASEYFKKRDPIALEYLPKLLESKKRENNVN